MTCAVDTCPEKPTHVVHWPGRTVVACPACAGRIKAVADHLGMRCKVTVIEQTDSMRPAG